MEGLQRTRKGSQGGLQILLSRGRKVKNLQFKGGNGKTAKA